MNDFYFLAFLLLVTLSLMFLGVLRKQYFFTLASGVGFILFGLFLMGGIHYSVPSGSTVTGICADNCTSSRSVESYETLIWEIPYNPYTSMFFILIGFLLFLAATLDYYKAAENPDTEMDDD